MNNMVERLTPLRQDAAPLRKQIIASLRSAIEVGRLKPGERLIERELCEQLNVSRTSLREALRELHAIGVLSSMDNRGIAVGCPTAEEAGNIYALRAVVEALVASQFVDRAGDDEFVQLTELGAALREAYVSKSVERIIGAKRAFYDCMCIGARNIEALDIIDRLTLRTSGLRSRSLARKERQVESIKEIEAIITAIEARDRDRAAAAASRHVENAAQSALL